jgi:hypothetical protein
VLVGLTVLRSSVGLASGEGCLGTICVARFIRARRSQHAPSVLSTPYANKISALVHLCRYICALADMDGKPRWSSLPKCVDAMWIANPTLYTVHTGEHCVVGLPGHRPSPLTHRQRADAGAQAFSWETQPWTQRIERKVLLFPSPSEITASVCAIVLAHTIHVSESMPPDIRSSLADAVREG